MRSDGSPGTLRSIWNRASGLVASGDEYSGRRWFHRAWTGFFGISTQADRSHMCLTNVIVALALGISIMIGCSSPATSDMRLFSVNTTAFLGDVSRNYSFIPIPNQAGVSQIRQLLSNDASLLPAEYKFGLSGELLSLLGRQLTSKEIAGFGQMLLKRAGRASPQTQISLPLFSPMLTLHLMENTQSTLSG
jgi:hypothetical protein